jgi:hypothetical protein
LSDLEKKRMEKVGCIIFTFGREKNGWVSLPHFLGEGHLLEKPSFEIHFIIFGKKNVYVVF